MNYEVIVKVPRKDLSAIKDVAVLQNMARSEIAAGVTVRELFVIEVTRNFRLHKKNKYFDNCQILDDFDTCTSSLESAIDHPNSSSRAADGRFNRKGQALRDAMKCRRDIIAKIPESLAYFKKDSAWMEQRISDEANRWIEPAPLPRSMTRSERLELDRSLAHAEGVREHGGGSSDRWFGYDHDGD